MKTTYFLCLGLLLLCGFSGVSCRQETARANSFVSAVEPAEILETMPHTLPAETMVYVCKSDGAKRYHLKQTCGALKRCKHEVVSMTPGQAEKIGLRLCGHED